VSLIAGGDEVSILSRNPGKIKDLPENVNVLQWDGKTIQNWANEISRTDAIINLTGENLSGNGFPPSRWTAARKQRILQSRLDSGKVLTKAVEISSSKPSVFVQASGVNYYGTKQPDALSEEAPRGDDFLANLSGEWEASSKPVEQMGLRRVIIRNGVVLSAMGGALPLLVLPYKLWVGGRIGSGKQIYSWIHILDEVRAIKFLIQTTTAAGPYNLTSPNPKTNDEFGREVGQVMHRPHYFPIPGFALHLALGEVASMVLVGKRVLPKKLLDLGFQFRFSNLDAALEDIMQPTAISKEESSSSF